MSLNPLTKILPAGFINLILSLSIMTTICTYSLGHATLTKTITLPVTLDYPFLTQYLQQIYFSSPGTTARIFDGNACSQLTLSHPKLTNRGSYLYFTARVFLKLGVPFGDNCISPIQWSGSIGIVQRPKIVSKSWKVTFDTLEVTLYQNDNSPLSGSSKIWQKIAPEVQRYMGDFSVDLAPPVENLKAFLLPLFPMEKRPEAQKILSSLHPQKIVVNDKGVTINIATKTSIPSPISREPSLVLSQKEIQDISSAWEMLDSFFVHIISTLSSQVLSEEDKDRLMDILLESRHSFVHNIQAHTLDRDYVRTQFVKTWTKLSPILRKQLANSPNNILAYLSFVTAADGLAALDEIGPALGIEISRNGLIRLLRLLHSDFSNLEYTPNLNHNLQKLFKTHPPPIKGQSIHPTHKPETQKRLPNNRSSLEILRNYLIGTAQAASPTYKEIKQWLAPKSNHEQYLENVRNLLHTATVSVLARRNVSTKLQSMYQKIIPSIAWQESCFRQFIVKNKKLTYLLSYNKSSVGIMQVNERVWRGIYDRNRLRWDIRYNAFAGCEIVDLYFQKYVFKRAPKKVLQNHNLMAMVLYAMYNGGPSQLNKFLQRHRTNSHYKSDSLFQQKYSWVIKEEWHQLNKCL